MQEVFEKIINKLEKQKEYYKDIRKNTYCRVTETSECDSCRADHFLDARLGCVDDAIKIVKQEAEQDNNGWIPCSEKLPEEHKLYDITFETSAGIHSDSAIYNPYLKRWLWDADETELVENEIFAWAEKREPYQPKGE